MLGLIAGRGDLPTLLIQAAIAQGREMVVLDMEGAGRDRDLWDISLIPLPLAGGVRGGCGCYERHPHPNPPPQAGEGACRGALKIIPLPLSELPHVMEIFRREQVTEVIMAGGLSRPPISAFKPSLLTAKLLGRIGKAFFAGDDALFKAIVQIFEEEGFRILGAEELLHDLLTPAGILTTAHPSSQAQEDIRTGIRLMQEIGKLDIGQALIIRNGQVLGVEALEGTDALIARCGELAKMHGNGYCGVLVKSRKPNQEKRVDLPSIGIETIRNLHQAGFAGVAIEAGGSLFIRRTEALTLANELGIFVQGFDPARSDGCA